LFFEISSSFLSEKRFEVPLIGWETILSPSYFKYRSGVAESK
jgi:hypothetical protein